MEIMENKMLEVCCRWVTARGPVVTKSLWVLPLGKLSCSIWCLPLCIHCLLQVKHWQLRTSASYKNRVASLGCCVRL